MGSDFQTKQLQIPASIDQQIDIEQSVIGDAEYLPAFQSSIGGSSESVTQTTVSGLGFSTLSLVETIEYNFLRRENSGGISEPENETDMGSSISAKKHVETPREIEIESEEKNSRPPSVEVCGDPGLEEAEGIAHAQLVTKINSTFDNGLTAEGQVIVEEAIGFASIVDEYKANKSARGKIQKGGFGPKESTSNSSKLNLTLTGLKAKQIDRFSASVTPSRVSASRRGSRNPNVMKSLEDRLYSSSQKTGGKKKPEWNRSGPNSEKTQNKTAKPRRPPRRVNLLAAIKPSNLDTEKEKFFASNFTVNPQFEYRYPVNEAVLARYNKASTLYLEEATAIMNRVLRRYGSYEKFEAATGGRLLTKTEIWNTVKRYLEREGFFGDIVVDISNDLLSRAAMTIISGRPTLSIRESSAREYWVEGLLRHEVGTHHLRFHNNRQQIWYNFSVRRQMELQPANPTEEGLASIHSVLMRKDPSLWRAAMLYYAAHMASRMSFVELFADLGKFLDSHEVRWDYCLRTKRGQIDTSKPGCFCKDQVYLNGILPLLQRRKTLDFHMLCTLGKVSYEDVERLRESGNKEGTKVPVFMKDIDEYRRRLDYIVSMNGLEKFLDSGSKEAKATEKDCS